MRTDPDDLGRPDQFPHFDRRQIALTHMHPVRAGEQRDIRPIVDDRDHTMSPAQFHEALGATEKFPAFEAFLAKLQRISPAVDRRFGSRMPIATADRFSNKHIKSDFAEHTGGAKGEGKPLFNVVKPIPDGLDLRRCGGGEGLEIFLDRSQRLTQPFTGGGDDFVQVLPLHFADRLHGGADIARCVAVKHRLHQNPAHRGRQFMADRLQ